MNDHAIHQNERPDHRRVRLHHPARLHRRRRHAAAGRASAGAGVRRHRIRSSRGQLRASTTSSTAAAHRVWRRPGRVRTGAAAAAGAHPRHLRLGRAFNYWNDSQQMANEGRPLGGRRPPAGGGSSLQSDIQQQASSAELRNGSSSVSSKAKVCVSFPNGAPTVGDPVKVSVTATYNSVRRSGHRRHLIHDHEHRHHAARAAAHGLQRGVLVIRCPSRADRERGGVLVMVAVFLPVLLMVTSFVIDVSNWW